MLQSLLSALGIGEVWVRFLVYQIWVCTLAPGRLRALFRPAQAQAGERDL